jgi:hypothetical protein
MPDWLLLLLIIVGAVVGVFLLDRLLLWMEAREWIYWRKRKPKGGGGIAGGLTAMHQIVEPDVRYVIEDRDQRKVADTSQQGAPPGEGNLDSRSRNLL